MKPLCSRCLLVFEQRPQAVHAMELAFVFGAPVLATASAGLSPPGGYPASMYGRNYSKQDAAYSEIIMSMFANFARSG